jgi:5'-3' exoribonuclease 1
VKLYFETLLPKLSIFEMGVPRLYPFLIKMFGKQCLVRFQEGERTFTIDNLYLDSNPFLHEARQYVYNYGQNKRVTDYFRHLSPEQKRMKVFELYFDSVFMISQIIVPTKILNIAIDGPAPLAKQAQQRQRRFASALERGETGETFEDSNEITPGTIFMLELTKYVHTRIRKEMNNPKSPWKNIKVKFSPPTVPGEGEHKILQDIRDSKNAMEESHCIFGPDGDLVMLTLAAHVPKMFLLRADQYNPGFYDFVDMGKVRRLLVEALYQGPGYTSHKRSLDDITNDFIILGFFVGNDFLPKIQMFMYLEDGLELMISTYASLSGGGTKNTLSKGGVINHQSFTRFVEELARREHSYILDQATPKADRQGKFLDPKFTNHTLLKHVKEVQYAQGKTKKIFDLQGYRADYYAKAGIDVNGEEGEESVKKICLDYLRDIAWVYEYYIIGLPSWRDFYAWHYAPLMYDLVQVMRDANESDLEYIYKFKKDKAPLPFVQLLSVLPPASSKLLPLPLQKLLLSPESQLVKLGYYPKEFKTDLEGKTKEHMGVVLLPFVDIEKVEKAYEVAAATMKNEYVRNSVGRAEIFEFDESYNARYASDYGNIENLHVRKSFV